MSAPVAVTGMGVLTPVGFGAEEHWAATLAGHGGLRPLTRCAWPDGPPPVVGEIADFNAAAHLPGRLLPQTDVSTRYALVAADWALQDAKIEDGTYTDFERGTVTSNACGGFAFTHAEFDKLWTTGPGAVSVYESFAWFYAVNTGQISIRNGLRGPSSALVAEQAGGLDAVAEARRAVLRGTPMMVTGGVDSALDRWGVLAQLSGGQVSTCQDPGRAYRPFDAAACGHSPGEGGAVLVLESLATARARGAHQVYGELVGSASTFDPPPGSGRPPGLRRAAELACADAGVSPGAIDVVFADAAGTPELDAAEAGALRALFGPYGVPVTAPKSMTGRLHAGAGPVDVATALLAIRDAVIPPTAATTDVPDDYGLDLVVGAPRPAPLETALVLARGRGGFNSALVVRRAR